MPPKNWSVRCSNPFKLKNHMRYKGLRKPSSSLRAKWDLIKENYLCTTCRLKLTNTEPIHVINEIQNDMNVPENINVDSIVVVAGHSNSIGDKLSEKFDNTQNADDEAFNKIDIESNVDEILSRQVSQLSQLSIETRLPVLNDGLQLLDESPIQRKILKSELWKSRKIDQVCHNLKKSLGVNDVPTSDTTDLREMIGRLKEKFHDTETKRAEKIQILTLLPINWSVDKIADIMNTSKYIVKRAKKLVETKGILSMPDPKAGRSFSKDTISTVLQFYNDDRVSCNMPGIKDYVSVRNDDNKRVHVQKRLILSNLKELFAFFRSEYPEITMSFSMFASLRPRHCVLAGASGTHTVCVCPIHQNVKLMMIGCDLKSLTSDSQYPLSHYNDCLDLIICRNPSPECYFVRCTHCPGIAILQEHLDKILDDNEVDEVRYKHWESNPRTTLETAIKLPTEFIDLFCNKIKSLLPHAFIAKEQADFMKSLKESLYDNEFLVTCDFAENYSFVVQNAVPGFHWNNNQVTVFPIVIYFRNDGLISHRSLIIISDCLSHDSTAVSVFQRILIDFIKSINEGVSKVYYFSDGAPQQFKNYKNFTNLYYHKEDYGIDSEWHFHPTAHGKGPCDGLGGTFKRLLARASLQLPPDRQITTVQDVYNWATQPLNLPNVVVKFSSQNEYEIAKASLKNRFENSKPIIGTQKLHCIIPQANGIVHVKPYSRCDEYESHKILKI